jgi:hypothetical protein
MRKLVKWRNIYAVLIYRLLIVMLLLSIARVGFYVFNFRMFPDIPFSQLLEILRGGLLFDISATVYINLIFIFFHIIPFEIRYNKIYQEILKYFFLFTNGIAIAINGADFVYYRFVLKRATSDIFQTFEHENNMLKLFFKFQIDSWPVVLFTILLIFLLVLLYNQVTAVKPVAKNRILYYSINVLMAPLIAGLVVIGARGGYKHPTRPISISNAAKYVDNPRDIAIVLNTPFRLIKTVILTRWIGAGYDTQ